MRLLLLVLTAFTCIFSGVARAAKPTLCLAAIKANPSCVTSISGYLFIEDGRYIIVPGAGTPFEYAIVSDDNKKADTNVFFPETLSTALKKQAGDSVLHGHFQVCHLLKKDQDLYRATTPPPVCVYDASDLRSTQRSRISSELDALRRQKSGKTESTEGPIVRSSANARTQSPLVNLDCKESRFRKGSCSQMVEGWVYKRSADGQISFQPMIKIPKAYILKNELYVDEIYSKFGLYCGNLDCDPKGPNFTLTGTKVLDELVLPEAIRYQFKTMLNDKTYAVHGFFRLCPMKQPTIADVHSGTFGQSCISEASGIGTVVKVNAKNIAVRFD